MKIDSRYMTFSHILWNGPRRRGQEARKRSSGADKVRKTLAWESYGDWIH